MSTKQIGPVLVERNDEDRTVKLVTPGGVDPVLTLDEVNDLDEFAFFGPEVAVDAPAEAGAGDEAEDSESDDESGDASPEDQE